jgi:hypothetical protein
MDDVMNVQAPVCIAGMHRSGTSLVARLLRHCGLDLGPEDQLMRPQPDNPEGFFENLPLVALNDAVLAELGGGWDLPPDVEPSAWLELAARWRERALAVLGPLQRGEPWGWKDPRNSLTLPFWQCLLPGLRPVICLRHPREVHRSLHRRGSSSEAFSLNLWRRYYGSLLECTTAEQRLVTHYQSYFADPVAELGRVVAWLGWPVEPGLVVAACGEVKSELRHHEHGREPEAPELPAELGDIYARLCREAGPIPATARPISPPPDPRPGPASVVGTECPAEPVPPTETADATTEAADDPRLIFLHIPKTAGSTMRRILERQYDPHRIFTLEGWRVHEKDFPGLPEAARARVRVLEGHQFFGLHAHLPGPARYLTLLRDPVERLVSQYYHILRSPEHYLRSQVVGGGMSLAEFAHAKLAPELDNGQLRYVAGLGHLPCGAIGAKHLEQARRILSEHYAVVGLVERFDESVLLMRRELGWRPPIYQRTNIGRNRPPQTPLSENDRAALREANVWEWELYRHAGELLDAAVAAGESGFTKELISFRAVNALPQTRIYLEQVSRGLAEDLNRHGEEILAAGDEIWALQAFMKAAEIWPAHAGAQLNLARYHVRHGEAAKAEPPAAAALQLDPLNPETHRIRAEVRRLAGADPAAGPAGEDRLAPIGTEESR